MNHVQKLIGRYVCVVAVLLLSACSSMPAGQQPLRPVPKVDLQRFVGNWYVIAHIPPWIESSSYNSVENYRIDEDGNIPTTFTYRNDSFDSELKTLHSKGFIVDKQSNAEWGIQFIWPIKAEYLITYLSDDYSRVIIARNKRDYVWLMARTPQISDDEYAALTARIAAMGYDLSKLRKVPQRWPEAQPRP